MLSSFVACYCTSSSSSSFPFLSVGLSATDTATTFPHSLAVAFPPSSGSKLATPITAPMITTTTTPPAAMLSKKFLREGETPEAASATSGITIEAVSAAAVIPVTAFSFKEALTWSLPLDFDAAGASAFESLSGSGLRKLSAEDWILFWAALVNGTAIVNDAVAAIFSLSRLAQLSLSKPAAFFCVKFVLDLRCFLLDSHRGRG